MKHLLTTEAPEINIPVGDIDHGATGARHKVNNKESVVFSGKRSQCPHNISWVQQTRRRIAVNGRDNVWTKLSRR